MVYEIQDLQTMTASYISIAKIISTELKIGWPRQLKHRVTATPR